MQAFIYLIQAIVVVLGTYLVMFVRKKIDLLKAKIGNENYLKLATFAQDVVKAMEQLYGSGTGEKKKQEAIKFITEYLGVDEKTAEMLIEAAVHEMNKVLKSNASNTKQQ